MSEVKKALIALFFSLMFFVFFGTAHAQGNSYYVSVAGNDSNPGTLAAPFKTIIKGDSLLVAGDTLYNI